MALTAFERLAHEPIAVERGDKTTYWTNSEYGWDYDVPPS
jgi:hypothetical protein